jgi:LDH2 family malate/lactate/ureidoglycolate dehydrogenase
MNGRDIRVPASFLESFMVDVFAGVGVPRREARVVARVLIASDLRGIESHGINRCKPIYYDRIRAGTLNPVTNMEVVRDRAAIAVIDGHNGMGHVVAERSMGLAIRKAKKYGIGMVAVRNSTHSPQQPRSGAASRAGRNAKAFRSKEEADLCRHV